MQAGTRTTGQDNALVRFFCHRRILLAKTVDYSGKVVVLPTKPPSGNSLYDRKGGGFLING
jgi:hypothetical protein